MPWGQRQNFSGDDPLQFGQMPGCSTTLGDLDQLENMLRNATQPGQLAEVDIDQARDLLGDDAARSLERLAGAGQDPRGGRPHRPARGPLRADAEGRARARPAGARRPVPQDDAGQGRAPRGRADRRRPRARVRAQALRVRRPVPPERRADGQERDLAAGRGHAGAPLTRGLRGRAHRAAHPLGDRADARRLAVDADARQLPARQEGRDGAALAHHHAVPARLLRARRVRPRRPRGEAASCSPR